VSGEQLRVCVIAPEAPGLPPLRWGRELGGLAEIEGVSLELVAGPDVREANVAQALRKTHEVVIWSGHGKENGLILGNGHVVKGRWVAAQARGGTPRAMVIAACGSGCNDDQNESLAWQVSKVGINVIGFPLELEDEAAICYTTEFVRTLIAGSDVGEAHDVAVEAIEHDYPGTSRQIALTPGLTNGYRYIVQRMNDQDRRLATLEEGQNRILTMMDQVVRRLPNV
jgi:hypothetical protein